MRRSELRAIAEEEGPFASFAEDVRPVLHLADREPRGVHDPWGVTADDLRRQVHTVVARDTVSVLEGFVEARGRDEAADGPEATLAALCGHRRFMAIGRRSGQFASNRGPSWGEVRVASSPPPERERPGGRDREAPAP